MIYTLPPGATSIDDVDFKGVVSIDTGLKVEGARRISMGRNYGGDGILGYKVKRGGPGAASSSGDNKHTAVNHETRNLSRNRRRLRG